MATCQDIVNLAAKRILGHRTGDTLEPEVGQDLLERLNTMLTGLEADNLNLNIDSDLTLVSTFPLADKHREGVAAMLAAAYAEDEDIPVGARLSRDAMAGYNRIWADYALPDGQRVDFALANMPSQRRVV